MRRRGGGRSWTVGGGSELDLRCGVVLSDVVDSLESLELRLVPAGLVGKDAWFGVLRLDCTSKSAREVTRRTCCQNGLGIGA